MSNSSTDRWPALSNSAFEPTRYLLHMILQAVGKLKLAAPFQAQWAHVPLWLSARGLTTGPIPYAAGVYEVRVDFISQELQWFTNLGISGHLPLGPTSVATFVDALLSGLRKAEIDPSITLMPQEVTNPVSFDEDKEQRPYDRDLVTTWWRILLSTQDVLHAFQGRFAGKTQPVGLMWGTFDIRLPLYNGKPASSESNDGFIRRNAMNAELMEMGWWSGDPSYPRPAFYSFTFPEPKGIEQAKLDPPAARWDVDNGEFLLDYDDLRQSTNPDRDLLAFLETTYRAGADAAGWDPTLLGSGHPT